MPIVRADLAEQVLVCNYDTKPGYAGVDSSYNLEKVHMLWAMPGQLAQLLEIVKVRRCARGSAAPEAAPADPAALLKSLSGW